MSERTPYPSYAACVANVLSKSKRPLTIDQILTEIARQRPVGTDARAAISRAINKLFQAVPVSPDSYGWLSHLLADSSFRHPLSGEESRRGFLMLDELEHLVFFPQFFQSHRPDGRTIRVDLFGGPTIEATATIERKTWSLNLGKQFAAWVEELGGQNRDDLLITVIDAETGRYAIRLNLREMRDERAIEQRNIQLAFQAEKIVTEDRKKRLAMPTWELAALLIGQGFFQEVPSVDDFHYVLHEYSLLRFTDGVGYQLDPDVDPDARQRDRERNLLTTLPSPSASANAYTDDEMSTPQPDDYSSGGKSSQRPSGYSSGMESPGNESSPDTECAAYAEYVAKCYEFDSRIEPVSHEDYHLLEAELEMLVRLEEEFGRLLEEQEHRKESLATQLFIDPEFYFFSDWDSSEDSDYEDPPFWQN